MEQIIIQRGEPPSWISSGYNGYGSGYGDGSGDGSGYGYGYNDCSGYGYGTGYGDGIGDGTGDGSGNGYGGYGYGFDSSSGYGAGSGSGSGSGSSSGSKEYWLSTITYFASKWQAAQSERMNDLKGQGAIIAFWRSNNGGRPSNGGQRIEPAAPGVIHTASGPLNLCAAGTLHATLLPPRWKGERLWVVALTGKIIGDGEKLGALSREIIGECL